MRLIIYICEEGVRVVAGSGRERVRIGGCGWFGLPPGTVVDGALAEEEELAKVLYRIGREYPKLRGRTVLVLGGGYVCHKIVEAPAGVPFHKRRQAMEEQLRAIRPQGRELIWNYSRIRERCGKDPSGQGGDSALDGGRIRRRLCKALARDRGRVWKRTGGTAIRRRYLCSALERERADSFVRLAKRCGLTVQEVLPSMACLARTGSWAFGKARRTCIAAVAEGGWLLTFLYVKGSLAFAGRERLDGDRRTEAFCREVSSVIRLVAKFHGVLDEAGELEGICIAGLYPEEEGVLSDIPASPSGCAMWKDGAERIRVDKGTRFCLTDYLTTVGALFGPGPLRRLVKGGRGTLTGGRTGRRLAIASLALWAGLYLCLWLYGAWELRRLQAREQEIRGEAARWEADAGWREQEAVRENLSRLRAYRLEEQELHRRVEPGRRLGGGFLGHLMDLGKGEVWLERIEYDDGSLFLVARAGDYRRIPGYVRRIADAGLFWEIRYTGFEAVADEADMRYRFSLNCRWSQ